MKLKEVNGRYLADMTRNEAFLLRDGMFEFATNWSEGLDWDSGCDPILVAQINKVLLEKVT